MKLSSLVLVVLLSALTAFSVGRYAVLSGETHANADSRLDRIKKAGVLRCGYIIMPPVINKDPNTGDLSGLAVDLFEEIGKQLSVKVEWTVEVPIATALTDLKTDRFDVMCAPFFVTPARAREAAFMTPILFHPSYLYVREGDARFDGRYDAANKPDVKFVTIDGDFSSVGAEEIFPQAKKIALPQSSAPADLYLNVANGKADAVVAEPSSFTLFNDSTPNKVRQVSGPPVRVMAVSFPLPSKEYDLKNALDASILFLHGSGQLDALFDKYDAGATKFLRLAKPYKSPLESP